ncbi:hypothetical protein [Azonexus sp.]|uniref:hypothetical protein n=1 Tax=Azonexus sp. TaxID=1872668 RepID=UPI0035B46A6F
MQAAVSDLPNRRKAAAGFIEVAKEIMLQPRAGMTRRAFESLAGHENPYVAKAVGAISYREEIFDTAEVKAMVDAYLETLAETCLLDALALFVPTLNVSTRNAMLASGSAGSATEGGMKIVTKPTLTRTDAEPSKAAAIVAMSKEFLTLGGDAALGMVKTEMSTAISKTVNQMLVAQLIDSNTVAIPASGDAVADLKAGIAAAGGAAGYVIAAASGVAAALALSVENRGGMGVRGGAFTTDVHVVATDEVDGMMVIPCRDLAIFDSKLELHPSGEAAIEMSDSPTGDGTLVSLFQTGSVGLLAERSWHIGGDAVAVIVEGS